MHGAMQKLPSLPRKQAAPTGQSALLWQELWQSGWNGEHGKKRPQRKLSLPSTSPKHPLHPAARPGHKAHDKSAVSWKQPP